MNFKLPVAGLLIGLLVACSETKQNPTVQSAPKQQQAPPTLSKDQVIQRAKLTPEQAEKLVSNVGDSKDFDKNNVIVLPTDLPDGFTVDELIVWRGEPSATHTLAGYYEIVYKNPYGACFLIGGGEISPRGEGYRKYEKISNIQSPALGFVELGFTDSEKQDGSKYIEFAESMGIHLKGRNEYRFESPFSGAFLHADPENYGKFTQKYKDCKMIKLQDAKRVVQSLQFLNP